MSNTGWPTDETTKTMHECHKPLMPPESEIIDKSQLDEHGCEYTVMPQSNS